MECEKGFKSEKQIVDKDISDSKVGEDGVEVNTTSCPSALEKPTSFSIGKHGPKLEEMWGLFNQLKVNISLVKLIKEVRTYVKILKDLCLKSKITSASS
uniref:Uncharacterized protein n=1 Tax=Lactuca sativa TaxID=4236 RepID=A0A9R1UI17_LACSA|nr:hypothetical protein LSAT_V11C900502800 [Lactuca sativa]